MGKKVKAEHGIVCRLAGDPFGYFGWPSIARMEDGTLVVASSGLRTAHVCPFGKTVLNLSEDEGRTWSPPRVIHKTPLDDRDAGVVSLGARRLLVSWFTSDTRQYFNLAHLSAEDAERWKEALGTWTDELVQKWLGSWVILSDDARTWSEPILAPVSTPHGPIRLKGGDLLYFGKAGFSTSDRERGDIVAARSSDRGRTWKEMGSVPLCEGTRESNYHEPHVVELEDGKLVGMIRFQYGDADAPKTGQVNFSMFQTESDDGGRTWTRARPTGVYGSPPHLLRHSSGALVCVYGYRVAPYGQRAIVSGDGGATWERHFMLRDDGPDGDLGYPASVEMPDGSLFTIYYQKAAAGEKCSLLWTRWELA
jgi:hypothetical protein